MKKGLVGYAGGLKGFDNVIDVRHVFLEWAGDRVL